MYYEEKILIFLSIITLLSFFNFVFFFYYFIEAIIFTVKTQEIGVFRTYLIFIIGLLFSIAILVLLSLSIYYLIKSDLPELKEKLSDLINNSKEKRKQNNLLKVQTKLEKIQNQINEIESEQNTDNTDERP